MINDDGDFIRGFGFLAIYSAALEDRIAELVIESKKYIVLPENIIELRLTHRLKLLLSHIKRHYRGLAQGDKRLAELELTNTLLKYAIKLVKKRNDYIHALYVSKNGEIMQKNRRKNSAVRVTSKNVYELANKIWKLRSDLLRINHFLKNS